MKSNIKIIFLSFLVGLFATGTVQAIKFAPGTPIEEQIATMKSHIDESSQFKLLALYRQRAVASKNIELYSYKRGAAHRTVTEIDTKIRNILKHYARVADETVDVGADEDELPF